MKKFNYLLLFAFWSFGHIVAGKCPGKGNFIPVEGIKFRGICTDYDNVFKAYINERTVVMSATVDDHFFKVYRGQIGKDTICVDKKKLKECIAAFGKILREAEEVSKKNIDARPSSSEEEEQRLQSLKSLIEKLGDLQTDPPVNSPGNTESLQKSTSKDNNKSAEEDDHESVNWAWFVAVFFGLATLGLGFWLRKLLDRQDYINRTLSHRSDELENLLRDSDSKYRPGSDKNQPKRIELLIRSLVDISIRDKQEINRLRQDIERYKEKEKALLEQKEAISSEFENYKIKSVGNKTSSATGKLDTLLQNSEQAPLPITKLFYLSYASPSSDGMGEFYDRRQPQPNSVNSYYRFEIEPDEINAKFWFYDTAGTVEGATRYPDTYLSPACEYSVVDPKAKHIFTKKEGVAKRTGDVWKVYRKAVIEFR